jgi:hypothetical protein
MRRATILGLSLTFLTAGLMACGGDDDGGTGGMGGTATGTGGTGAGGGTGGTGPQNFEVTIENLSASPTFAASGVFDTPVGEAMPGPLTPGASYEVTFAAAPGLPGRPGTSRVTFAAMFVPSNDLFFAPGPDGIALYEMDGTPRSGDVTADVAVWDAGTEADEPLNGDMNTSPNQKAYQAADAENVGPADPNTAVRLGSETYPGEIPVIEDLLTVTLSSEVVEGVRMFTLSITNDSGPGTLGQTGAFGGAVPLSPGVWAVYGHEDGNPGPLFTTGEPDFGNGLASIAEDGFPMALGGSTSTDTGLIVVSSPGAWAVHDAAIAFLEDGATLADTGLEAIAEDGDATAFLTTLGGLDEVSSSGMIGEMPFGPGGTVTFEVTASPGDVLSLATMFVPSNDLLFTNGPDGIALFDADGSPNAGNVSTTIGIWDAGTEVNQEPGYGIDQVHLQSGPDTGADDSDDTVRPVNDGFTYPAADDVFRVTITPTGAAS